MVREDKLKEGNRKKEGRWSDTGIRLGKFSAVTHKTVKCRKENMFLLTAEDLNGT